MSDHLPGSYLDLAGENARLRARVAELERERDEAAPDVAAAAERIVATLWDDDASMPPTPDSLWLYGRATESGLTADGCRRAALEFAARVLAGLARPAPVPAAEELAAKLLGIRNRLLADGLASRPHIEAIDGVIAMARTIAPPVPAAIVVAHPGRWRDF